MSQVDVNQVQPLTDVSNSVNAKVRASTPKRNQNQQQCRQSKPQQQKGPSGSKQGVKGPKGLKTKGPKAGAVPPQPYYQELIMQLTNAPEWRQCQSKDVQEAHHTSCDRISCLKDSLQPGSVITMTTTTTTTTTTQATLTVPEADRPQPHRLPSYRSIRSFKSAKSYQSEEMSALSSDPTESPLSSSPTPSELNLPDMHPRTTPIRRPAAKAHGHVLTLSDMHATSSLHALLSEYGGVQHGGILDPAYSFFVNRAATAAISFIVKDRVAVVGGDPLCPPDLFDSVFAEFAAYRKKHRLGITIFGGSDALVSYAQKKGWPSIRFGNERVLNPITNPVLHGKVQKQIIRQNKALLDPNRGGNTLNIYAPATGGRDIPLENSLRSVYDAWKDAKNASGNPQRYTTVYDPFALPDLMLYIYTRDRNGTPNGLAALRKLGAKGGFYIDPCVAAPGAPSRIPDLLYFTAMGLLNMLGCGYLAIGMEPASELSLSGFPEWMARWAKRAHGGMYESLRLEGKREYHAKFRPDEELGSGLHMIFPGGMPGPRRVASCVHFANISLREVVKERWVERRERRRAERMKGKEEQKEQGDNDNNPVDGDA